MAGSRVLKGLLWGLLTVLLVAVCADLGFRWWQRSRTDEVVSVRILADRDSVLSEIESERPELSNLRDSSRPQFISLAYGKKSDLMSYLEQQEKRGRIALERVKQRFRAPFDVVGEGRLSERMLNFRRRFEKDPLLESITFATARARSLFGFFESDPIGDARNVALPLSPSETVLLFRESQTGIGPEPMSGDWSGSYPTDSGPRWAGTKVSAADTAGAFYALIEHDQLMYEIRPLGDGEYAIVRANLENDPGSATIKAVEREPVSDATGPTISHLRAGPGGGRVLSKASIREKPRGSLALLAITNGLPPAGDNPKAEADSPPTTVGLVVAYTTDAVDEVDFIPAMIRTAVRNAQNSLYQSSIYDLQFDLECVVRSTQTSRGNLQDDLRDFSGADDGFLDEIHKIRSNANGDLVILITGQSSFGGAHCGLAKTIHADTAAEAFAVVRRDCVNLLDGFVHEVGHLFGAAHENVKEADLHKPYGRGAVFGPDERKYRSVMTNHHACSNCQRLPLWSSPRFWDRIKTGSETQNNLRVVREEASHIASLADRKLGGNQSCVDLR